MAKGLALALLLVPLAAGAQATLLCYPPDFRPLLVEQRWEEALAVQRKRLAENDWSKADKAAHVCVRASIATSLAALDRHEEAIAALVPLINEARKALGNDHPETLNAEVTLAGLYGNTGQQTSQVRLLQDLRPRIARTHGARSLQSQTLLRNLSIAYLWLRNDADAVALSEEALAIALELDRKLPGCPTRDDCAVIVADSRVGLASALRRVKRAGEARGHAQAAVTELEKILGPTHGKTLNARLVLAGVLGDTGERATSLEMQQEILAAAERHLGPDHAITRNARANVAASLYAAGKRQESIDVERAHLVSVRQRRGANHPEALNSLNVLAERLLQAGEVDAALPLLEEAIGVMLATRAGLSFDDRLTYAWQGYWQRVVSSYTAALLRKNRVGDAFLATEFFKARLLAERMSLDPAERGLSEADRTTLRQLRRRLAAQEQQLALKRSMGAPTAQDELVRANMQERLGDFKPAASVAEGLPDAKAPPAWYRGLGAAERDSARVSYLFLSGWVYAFVDLGGQVRLVRLANAEAVRETVESYRLYMREFAIGAGMRPGTAKSLPKLWKRPRGGYAIGDKPEAGAEAVEGPAPLLQFLGESLLTPLAPYLKDKQRVLISPYSVLSYVPFEALALEGKRLGHQAEVALLPSFALHAQLLQRKELYAQTPRRPFLGFGGAPYQRVTFQSPLVAVWRERKDDVRAMDLKVVAQGLRRDPKMIQHAYAAYALGWSDLPGTLAEVRQIARMLGKDSFYLGEERASEANLYRLADDGELARYRVLHFSAHGFLSEDEPALSAVVLAQVNRAAGTDGYVTVPEIAALELRTDLVVLSTCDSGVGKLQQGEGILGMTHALFQAGTVSSIVTLWPIPEKDSARLMVRFYEVWQPGMTAARALAEAKRWGLANGIDAPTVDAFVLFGI